MRVSVVVAMGPNAVIGNKGGLPWGKMPKDLERFKKITTGHHILMGRVTLESIIRAVGHPLPGRTSIVLTRQQSLEVPEGVLVTHSVEQSLTLARDAGEKELMVIGGAEVYRELLDWTTTLYLTIIRGGFEGDACSPIMPPPAYDPVWYLKEAVRWPADKKNSYPYEFRTYIRRSAAPAFG